MSLPRYASEFVQKVWEECRANEASYSKEDLARYGRPPKELRIFEATSAESDFPREPHSRAWRLDESGIEECKPTDLAQKNGQSNGMYWQIATATFHVNLKKMVAIYSYVLGPRYARGFEKPFDDLDSLVLTTDGEHMVWLS